VSPAGTPVPVRDEEAEQPTRARRFARAGTAASRRSPLAGLERRPLPPVRVRGRGASALRTIAYLLLPLAVLFGVRALVAEPFGIPSDSMVPTLQAGDRVIANKLAYRFGSPQVGDLAVLQSPTGEVLAKRVVASAGQRVEIRDGVLYVDRRRQREPYVDQSTIDGFFFGPVQVAANSLFVLGDNRAVSEDSRDFGAVSRDRFVGRVDLTIPPLDRLFGAIAAP
jgi:signal peptidase I